MSETMTECIRISNREILGTSKSWQQNERSLVLERGGRGES